MPIEVLAVPAAVTYLAAALEAAVGDNDSLAKGTRVVARSERPLADAKIDAEASPLCRICWNRAVDDAGTVLCSYHKDLLILIRLVEPLANFGVFEPISC